MCGNFEGGCDPLSAAVSYCYSVKHVLAVLTLFLGFSGFSVFSQNIHTYMYISVVF